MSPMPSLQFFQPMVHVPMTKIDGVSHLAKPMNKYLVYAKPVGVDVYITGGRIFDFNHKELTNRMLLFSFEKVLQTTLQMQSLFIGTLCSITEPTKIIKHQPLMYINDNALPFSVRFLVYDVIFPHFKIENPFWCRNDIARKTVEKVMHCTGLEPVKLESIAEFKEYVKQRFNIDRHTSFIVFDRDGLYHSGIRQLTYSPYEQVSFELSASQKYRSHIHKILPINIELSEGNTIKVAGSIETRFKNTLITVPIIRNNYILQKNMWDHRKELKRMPFSFEGIYFEDDNGKFEILGLHYSKFIL